MTAGLRRLNALDERQARAELMRCCGSARWARRMAGARPFASAADAMEASERGLDELARDDWLEAFGHHPSIGGEDLGDRRFDATRGWSAAEQSGVAGAAADVRRRLAAGNEAYRRRFGWVFLICATGRSAAEMADALERRLGNDAEAELDEAAEQQRLITRLRLAKLLGS